MALAPTVKKQALAALRDLKARKMSLSDEAAATRLIAAEFVTASQSIEGHETTRAQVLAAAEEQCLLTPCAAAWSHYRGGTKR
jgi:Fic family protein